MSTHRQVTLAQRPKEAIIPGQTFKIDEVPSPSEADLKEGEVLFQTLYLSLDPAMRGWLNDARSYVPPVKIGEVMRGACIGQIIASKSSKLPIGTYATATAGWTELRVMHEKACEKIEVPSNGKVTDALGVLGMTGLTAYFGILDVGKVKAGDVVVVSGAAGATGSVVGQIAKLKGAYVVGIAGSDEKIDWLKKELHFDEALNYKDPAFKSKLKAATKDLIDVYFDNVGGEILDLCLAQAKPHSRFVMCGAISQYNSSKPQGPRNYLMIISMRIRMEGFIVFDYASQYAQARKDLTQWLNDGKIRRSETIVKGGLAQSDVALTNLYKGINKGKLLVEVKAPSKASL